MVDLWKSWSALRYTAMGQYKRSSGYETQPATAWNNLCEVFRAYCERYQAKLLFRAYRYLKVMVRYRREDEGYVYPSETDSEDSDDSYP
jgi:hypothetical protein